MSWGGRPQGSANKETSRALALWGEGGLRRKRWKGQDGSELAESRLDSGHGAKRNVQDGPLWFVSHRVTGHRGALLAARRMLQVVRSASPEPAWRHPLVPVTAGTPKQGGGTRLATTARPPPSPLVRTATGRHHASSLGSRPLPDTHASSRALGCPRRPRQPAGSDSTRQPLLFFFVFHPSHPSPVALEDMQCSRQHQTRDTQKQTAWIFPRPPTRSLAFARRKVAGADGQPSTVDPLLAETHGQRHPTTPGVTGRGT